MAEAELTIKYREAPVTVAFYALVTMAPIVMLFGIWSTLVIGMAVASGQIHGGAASLVILAEVFALIGWALAIMITADQTIFITRDGISLPCWLCPVMRLRCDRAWSLLRAVSFKPNSISNRGNLTLVFTRGRAKLNLHCLPAADIERLIVAIDVWAGGADNFPALLEARMHVGGKMEGGNQLSATRMWEDELTRRFGATNFVPLEPGEVVRNGAFTVERQLAFGGLSAIYLVRDGEKKLHVLKEAVIPSDSDAALKEKATELFEREAEILARLAHPNVARVLDHFVEEGRNYLLLEYIEGDDLRRLVKERGEQGVLDVITWGREIAEVLVYLHGQETPILHRDISPDNIILREDGSIAVIDFGAANLLVGTATGTMIGKQAYIAPEQLRGKASVRSDIYALGCTLHFLLVGKDPEALSVSHPREQRSKVSVELDALIAACTQQDETERVKGAREFLQRLALIEGTMP